jgi:argininosuccinate lyase
MKKPAKKQKLWNGRFSKPMDVLVEKFTASIGFDARLYQDDILGSIAHVRMLKKIGLLKESEMKKIVEGLQQIRKDIENGKFEFDEALEDVHMNIESELILRLGDVGAKLHTARSRNDQIAVDMRMWLKRTINGLITRIRELQRILVGLAAKHVDTIFPGYTHMQLAQSVVFAHHLLAYVEMLERDKGRLKDAYDRADESPLGCGALAGTSIPIDRKFVAKELGFARITRNSLDAVSDRDFLMEYLSALAITAVHFSRFAEELVIWSSSEFGYIEIDDAFCTGSSMLPHKKNPDVAELIRGKSGQFVGELVSILTLMKGLPLSYNRDMQEDKLPVFRATDAAFSILEVLCPLVNSLRVRVDKVRKTLEDSSVQAIDLAEYLVRKGIPFRESHFIVGKIVRYAEEQKKPLKVLALDELRSFSKKFGKDALALRDPMKSPWRKMSEGSTSPKMVKQNIKYWQRKLKENS